MSRSSVASAAWSVLLFWSRFGINALVFLIMVRWITPVEIGAYGAVFAVVQIFQAVQMSGLPETVIRSGWEDDADTAFWLSCGLGIVMAISLFFSAPLLGRAFGGEAAPFARALAVVPLVMGCGAMSEAFMRREMMLDRLALRTAATLSAAGFIAIALAAAGLGGWSLVAFTIVNNAAASLLNLLMAPWRPRPRFNRSRLGSLVRDAASISGRNVVKSALNPTSQFIVTGLLGTPAGGIYLVAVRFATIMSSLTIMPAQYAALPIFSRLRNDPNRRRSAFVDAMAVMSFLASPLFVGAAVVTPSLLRMLLGDIGMEAAPVVQGLLFHSPVLALLNLGVPALVAVDRAGAALRFTLALALLNIPFSLIAALVSVTAVGWSSGLLHFAVVPLILKNLRDEIGADVPTILAAAFRPWFAALIMGAAVWFGTPYLPPHWHPVFVLAAQAAGGFVVYVTAAAVIALPQFRTTLSALMRMLR